MNKKKFSKKIMNKKGIIDIGGFLSSFLDLIPGPLKIILAISIILLIGNLFQWTLQIFGIFCDGSGINGNPVRVPINVLTTTNLLQKSNEFFQKTPSLSTILTSPDYRCVIYAESTSIYTKNFIGLRTFKENRTTEAYYYLLTEPCAVCEGSIVYLRDIKGASLWLSLYQVTSPNAIPQLGMKVCDGNVIRNEGLSKAIWIPLIMTGGQKCQIAENTGDPFYCTPPEKYRYNRTTNQYECKETDCRGRSLKDWDSLLHESGA